MRIKSPIRFTIFLLILCTFIYLGYTAAARYIDLPVPQFAFWNKTDNNEPTYQNFVVAGVDDEGTRTDLILFCQYDFVSNSVNVIQVPRDTKVETERSDKKINSAYGSKGGADTMLKELSDLLGIKADKYVIVSFKAFRNIIDALGGVEIDVPMRMYYTDPVQNLTIDLYPGKQQLSGKQAEMFMRFRKNNNGTGYPNGDVDRIKAQQALYSSLSDKLLSGNTILKIPKLLGIIKDNVKTNFTAEEIVSYLGKVGQIKRENINIMALEGVGKYETVNGVSISYFIHDKEKTKQMIEQYFTPSSSSLIEDKGISLVKNKFIKLDLVDASGYNIEDINVLEIVKQKLEKYGFKVLNTTVSEKVSDKSRIIEHSNKNSSAEILKVCDGLPVVNEESESTKADATVIIGSDFKF